MVNIFYFPVTEESTSNVVYSVTPSETGLAFVIKCLRFGNEVTKEFFLDYSSYLGCVLQIGIADTDSPNELFINKIFNFVDVNTFKVSYQTNKNQINMVRVIINDDASDVSAFLLLDTSLPEGAGWTPLSRSENCLTGHMKEKSEYFSNLISKRKIKAKMVNDVDIYASVSYLEAQVDILTRALRSILPETHELCPLIIEADSHSVLDIKSPEKIASEFNGDKDKIRRLQATYYAEKNTLN